jgi:hypothetical protein
VVITFSVAGFSRLAAGYWSLAAGLLNRVTRNPDIDDIL